MFQANGGVVLGALRCGLWRVAVLALAAAVALGCASPDDEPAPSAADVDEPTGRDAEDAEPAPGEPPPEELPPIPPGTRRPPPPGTPPVAESLPEATFRAPDVADAFRSTGSLVDVDLQVPPGFISGTPIPRPVDPPSEIVRNVNVRFGGEGGTEFNVAVQEYPDEETAARYLDLHFHIGDNPIESAEAAADGVPVFVTLVEPVNGWRTGMTRVGRWIVQFNSSDLPGDVLHDMALATALAGA
jgi:hypothetical protein